MSVNDAESGKIAEVRLLGTKEQSGERESLLQLLRSSTREFSLAEDSNQ